MSKARLDADYVIIGAGSAGCVLANRLSADGSAQVLLLEAGGDDRPLHEPSQFFSNINIHLPAGFTRMLNDPKINWNYRTEPDPETKARVHAFPRGKVLGGTSSINGMLYVRGLMQDYDGWRQLGLEGWSWEDVEPYFRRAEDQVGGDVEAGGIGGPVHVEPTPMRHPVSDAIIEAFGQIGVKRAVDLNGRVQEGIQVSRLNTRRGLRQSSAVAYLHPAMKRANLRVEMHFLVTRMLFEGTRCVGVEGTRGGETIRINARREVILSGGAINSPQMLQLSGIGQPELLSRHGIPIVAAVPGVGENLQDHLAILARGRLKPGSPSLNSLSQGLPLAGEIAKFILARSGLLAIGGAHITAFTRSGPEQDMPDLQFFSSPATVDLETIMSTGKMVMEKEPGITIGGYPMRPQSRGSIHIASADPRQAPAIRPNYLTTEADKSRSIAVMRIARAVMRQPALASYFEYEQVPGDKRQSDEELLSFIRSASSTAYHQSCTCAMGTVLDAHLRVKDVQGLRVVDASAMPNIVSGNTHAATVMIAEKAADMIQRSRKHETAMNGQGER